jgi:hypothetical protein
MILMNGVNNTKQAQSNALTSVNFASLRRRPRTPAPAPATATATATASVGKIALDLVKIDLGQ